jgi:Flp pilus assembly protein TadG
MRPRRKRSQDGNVAIEYGLILPMLLLLVLGIVDTGRLLWTYATLSHAVDAAARCGAITAPSCANSTQIAAYAVTQAYGLVIPSTDFTVTSASCGLEVNGAIAFVFIIPWLNGAQPFGTTNSINVSATACYPT